MDSVFAALKNAREAKRLSLADIADATLINVDFLSAIEQGKTDILPQTYVRAFMREYASFVGLDPAEIMKRYDDMQKPRDPERPPIPREVQAPVTVVTRTPEPRQVPDQHKPINPQSAKLAILGILAVVLSITLWNLLSSESPVTTETSFDTVIKDNETREGVDSIRAAKGMITHGTKGPVDSLTLRAVTTDTVWMQLTIDASAPREYLLRPNAHISWKAKERFVLTVGKPTAVEFTLNQKPLGMLVKRDVVIRNMTITRDLLAKK